MPSAVVLGNQSFLGFLQSFLGETTGGDNDYSKVSRGQQLGDENPKKSDIDWDNLDQYA